MSRWGRRWMMVPGQPDAGPVPGTGRVGGRYVPARQGRPLGPDGQKMRSTWECNYAYLLRYLGIPYTYEPRKLGFREQWIPLPNSSASPLKPPPRQHGRSGCWPVVGHRATRRGGR
jgi:hypothetical protein